MEGAGVGVGIGVGVFVGAVVGVGTSVGAGVGATVGVGLGLGVGLDSGVAVGVGTVVGVGVATVLASPLMSAILVGEGAAVGSSVGSMVGMEVGVGSVVVVAAGTEVDSPPPPPEHASAIKAIRPTARKARYLLRCRPFPDKKLDARVTATVYSGTRARVQEVGCPRYGDSIFGHSRACQGKLRPAEAQSAPGLMLARFANLSALVEKEYNLPR